MPSSTDSDAAETTATTSTTSTTSTSSTSWLPRPRRHEEWAAAALLLAALLVMLAAGLAMASAPTTTVVGRVGAFGGGGDGCYPTVSYTVGGEGYQLTASSDRRWCTLSMGGPATVYYDPASPADGRLARYGELPWLLTRVAFALVVLAALVVLVRRGDSDRVPRILAWLLVVGWIVASVAIALGGERQSDVFNLQDAVARGDVHIVGASGGLDPRERGYSLVELHWSEHGIKRVAEVVQTRGRRTDVPTLGSDQRPRVIGDLATYLTLGGGSVSVEPAPRSDSGVSVDMVGWHVTGRLIWPLAALMLLTLCVLAVAREPWRATRWAWFWLVLALPPFGALGFLLLGGPTRLGGSRVSPRRFTGGWAFILAVVLT